MDPKRSVLTTMALADAFGWAMTSFELWRYAIDAEGRGSQMPKQREILAAVNKLVSDGVLAERDGHYVFSGQEAFIDDRIDATRRIWSKRRRARTWARRMVKVPYVLGVFAYGSLATGATKRESDLDVFVVMRNGRIFTGRVLVSLMLETFGVRRTATRVADQVCLNHFVREDGLEFPQEYRSAFSAWLWARMFPLALRDESLAASFAVANNWVRDYFPNIPAPKEKRVSKNQSSRDLPSGDWAESLLGGMQLRRIARHPLTKRGKGRVVANSREMIFHPGLPEEAVMERFRSRLMQNS